MLKKLIAIASATRGPVKVALALMALIPTLVFVLYPSFGLTIRFEDMRGNLIGMESRLPTGSWFRIEVTASDDVLLYLYSFGGTGGTDLRLEGYRLQPAERHELPAPGDVFELADEGGRERVYLVFTRERQRTLETARDLDLLERLLDLAHARGLLHRLLTAAGVASREVTPLTGEDEITCWFGGPCVYSFAILHVEG